MSYAIRTLSSTHQHTHTHTNNTPHQPTLIISPHQRTLSYAIRNADRVASKVEIRKKRTDFLKLARLNSKEHNTTRATGASAKGMFSNAIAFAREQKVNLTRFYPTLIRLYLCLTPAFDCWLCLLIVFVVPLACRQFIVCPYLLFANQYIR